MCCKLLFVCLMYMLLDRCCKLFTCFSALMLLPLVGRPPNWMYQVKQQQKPAHMFRPRQRELPQPGPSFSFLSRSRTWLARWTTSAFLLPQETISLIHTCDTFCWYAYFLFLLFFRFTGTEDFVMDIEELFTSLKMTPPMFAHGLLLHSLKVKTKRTCFIRVMLWLLRLSSVSAPFFF